MNLRFLILLFICDQVFGASLNKTKLCSENEDISDNDQSSFYPVEYYYLFDEGTNECYHKGDRGPCGPWTTFEPSPENAEIGICNCLVMKDHCDTKNKIDLNFPIIRAEKDNKCYPLFQRGPCSNGEILLKNPKEEVKGTCVQNPCKDEPLPQINWELLEQEVKDFDWNNRLLKIIKSEFENNWYIYEGKCYKQFSQGHCKNETNLAAFDGTINPVPKCFENFAKTKICPFWSGGEGFFDSSSFTAGELNCAGEAVRSGNDCVHRINSQLEEEE